MKNEHNIFGAIGIFIGIMIFVKTGSWIPSSIPALIGIALIFFSKENKIEKRKDE